MLGSHPPRTGVLVVTAWTEGDDPPSLRARLSGTVDVTSTSDFGDTAVGVEEICDAVRRWLVGLMP